MSDIEWKVATVVMRNDYGQVEFVMAAEAESKLEDKDKRILELEASNTEARRLIDAAVDIMTREQVGTWAGVRAWLEGTD